MIDLHDAILATHKNVVCVRGTTAFDKDDEVVELDMALVNAEISRLGNERQASEYKRLRSMEYAKLNQHEMQFDDLVNNTATWRDTILAIKAKYPKP